MEQWQFLIQKEGERTWHLLQKPKVEVRSGRYRVVARSNRTNTDVEVRVTHSSPNEVPPSRRIQKRRRRTNSEGLTAVIPFTYLKSGIWELQCSGDLMSDLLGASWQYTVSLVVVPSLDAKTVSPSNSSKSVEKQYKVSREGIQTFQAPAKTNSVQSSRYSPSSNELKTNDAGLISSISIEPLKNKSRNTNVRQLISTPSASVKVYKDKEKSEKPAEKLRESLKASSDKQKALSKSATQKLRDSIKATPNKPTSASSVPKTAQSPKSPPDKTVNTSIPKSSQKSLAAQNKVVNKVVSDKPTQKPQEKLLATQNKVVSKVVNDKPIQKPEEKSFFTQNIVVNDKPTLKEEVAIIEQTLSPVRLKGDTAEQILQNLIELALPSSSTLLADEAIEDTPIAPPLPLLLTLAEANYVARWGESITLNGEVKLKQTTNEQIKQITDAEVRIELISPQNSELLQTLRQPNPDQTLPFAIASSIDLPPYCSSKLILGEVKIYGALSSNGVVELLASESFTITADITELLAITVASASELDTEGYSTEELLTVDNAHQTSESSVSLDLELFNLVNTAKPERSVIGVPSTKKSLPPRIDPRRFRQRIGAHSPKLPNVPGYQEKIDEYINNGHIYLRGSSITGTSFPYLRKLQPVPCFNVEVKSDVYEVEESTYGLVADNQNIAEKPLQAGNSNLAELVVDRPHSDNSFEFESPVTPRSSEFIAAEDSNTSPLIRKWMLSQGYSLPEPIDVEYEDYDIEAPEQISHQQARLAANTKSDDNSKALERHKGLEIPTTASSLINIQATSSPYFSISTASGWGINQIATPPTKIAQEIVVDDTELFADNISIAESSEKDQAINQPVDQPIKKLSSVALTISSQKIEQLPTPQLYVPQGELIAGKSVNVRVRLPQINSDLAVKLWLEDCQTRHLLDDPHLLTNLTPNKNGELEVITKLNIPFGCIEIRLEAIAINRTTQQESHKSTIQRTVIPPDLPNIQFDAILGM
jgi:hypothetical protein